jgi:hypothetical protein
MRYFVVFLFTLFSLSSFAQQQQAPTTVSATLIDDGTLQPIENVNVININTVKGTISDANGNFTIEARANDTLHISMIGYQSIKVRVTNDWIKNKNGTNIPLTEKAYALEEVVITKYNLTGILPIDAKLAPVKENYRYSIKGLSLGYEAGENSPGAFKRTMSSIFNPADLLHGIFGKKPAEMRRLREMKKDDAVRNALAERFDRETLAALLGISKDEIPQILERCHYSEDFIKTANDLQIMDAISGCYEEYKVLNQDKKR